MYCINSYNTAFVLTVCFLLPFLSWSQNDAAPSCYDSIIGEIGVLESNRDPKCHATANRLEDFMYGTPLSFEARKIRIELQKDLAKTIWHQATQLSESFEKVEVSHINAAADPIQKIIVSDGELYVETTEEEYLSIPERDLRQYSTIAYGLRAILAVQQEALFDPNSSLKTMSPDAIQKLKTIIDISTVGTLKLADYYARLSNSYEITQEQFEKAWNIVIHSTSRAEKNSLTPKIDTSNYVSNYEMLKKTINQKLVSYENYNQLNQAVFLRNIQVYFAKVRWPKDETEANEIVTTFQDGVIQYSVELIHFAEMLAKRDSSRLISIDHLDRAVNAFLPYEVNQFEDVIYFPLLPSDKRINIEAYDLDAFRDSGLHWQLLKYALEEPSFRGQLETDPFAAELLVESIAQFGVLLWRTAGEETLKREGEFLSPQDLLLGMKSIQAKTKQNNGRYGTEGNEDLPIQSSDNSDELTEGQFFIDVTSASGILFEHRSADWLSRGIRSYVHKKDENIARLSIPPAFGGSGVAAEDVNGDGYDDILLLGGAGNRLFLNNGDKTYRDYTAESGLINLRPDGTYAEPRQPIIADFNNDGYQDVFISYVNDPHRIYMGNGSGTFEDQTTLANLGGIGLVGGPCTAFDYDKDGLLDLYIGYFGNYLEGELPTLSRTNTNGTPNQLFRNKGNFQFENVTERSGIDNRGWTQAVGHTDINNDGWQDLIVGNDFGTNAYYINNQDGTFTDQSSKLNTDKPSYTMNVGVADLNRDQYPDLYISNIVVMEKDDKYVLPNEDTPMHFDAKSLSTMRVVEANDLFLSGGKKKKMSYTNSKNIDRGYASTGWSWDADFFDFDNDGDEDLYCVNGMNQYSVYGVNNPYYLSPEGDAPKVAFAESAKEKNVFFKNENGKLTQASLESGMDLYHTSRSAAYTDYDLDGDLDVILSNYHGAAYFFENQSDRTDNNWLKLKLISYDQGVNKDAIGTKIMVSTKNIKNIWREVHSTDGYLSGHPKTMHFGLGKDQSAQVKIIWPDGIESKTDVKNVNGLKIISRKDTKITIN